MTTKDKALEIIEVLTTPDIKMSDKEKLKRIYTFAHAARGDCGNPHTDWIEDIKSTYKDFKEAGLL